MKIFISYPKKLLEKADSLSGKLYSMSYKHFVDYDSIPTGSPWPKEIREQLKKCDTYIILFESNAIDPESFFIKNELYTIKKEVGLEPEKEVFSVVFHPSEAKDLPSFYRNMQSIAVNEEGGKKDVWTDNVITAVEDIIEKRRRKKEKEEEILKEKQKIKEEEEKEKSRKRRIYNIFLGLGNFFYKNTPWILVFLLGFSFLLYLAGYFPKPRGNKLDIVEEVDKRKLAMDKAEELCSDLLKYSSFEFINMYSLFDIKKESIIKSIKDGAVIPVSYGGNWGAYYGKENSIPMKCTKERDGFLLSGHEYTNQKMYLKSGKDRVFLAESKNDAGGKLFFGVDALMKDDISPAFERRYDTPPSSRFSFTCENKKAEEKDKCNEKMLRYRDTDFKDDQNQGEKKCSSILAKTEKYQYIIHICGEDNDDLKSPYFRIMRAVL